MKRRMPAIRTAVITVLVAAGPAAGVAHAQADLDCRDFVYQEDAQAEFNRDTSDPHRLDEDQGLDDGIACEVLPRRGTTGVTPSGLPQRGTDAGLGGSAESVAFEVVLGVGLAVSALALAAGHIALRRRRINR